MNLQQPLVFEPIFMERVWGGRRLETMYHKRLPMGVRIGESWEIVDREDAQSVVHEGPLRGEILHDLWTKYREPIFGAGLPDTPRFPLLFKILDAQERLSVQVHPPASVAASLGGEPKTEMWYLLDASLGSDLYAGLKAGVTRTEFERALGEGRIADLIHRVPTSAGEVFFIPSGRIHAIGAGNLIFEVQQNSDTTYRVFDWNRVGLDGKPRTLHVSESLASINFDDPNPPVEQPTGETLVSCPHFIVEKWRLETSRACPPGRFSVFTVVQGEVECGGRRFQAGDFFLIPANMEHRDLRPGQTETVLLRTQIPAAAA